jgi:cleavage and polyadenylation specificity factor subunit 3
MADTYGYVCMPFHIFFLLTDHFTQILVHGEQHNMMRLKSKLLSLNANKTHKAKVFSPRNCEELRIPFKADKTAKVVGKLASIPLPRQLTDSKDPDPASAPLVTGVLVQNDFKLSLMAPEDLREYAGLNTTTITCRQRLRLSAAGIDLIKWALEGTFGAVEELPEMRRATTKNGHTNGDAADGEDGTPEEADEEVANLIAAYLVMGCVTVRYRTNGEVELEWEGNMLNDGIADSVMAVLFSVESSPAAVKRSSAKHSHDHSHETHNGGDSDGPVAKLLGGKNPHAKPSPADRLERLLWFLEAQFGADNVAPVETPRLPTTAVAATTTDAAADGADGTGEAMDVEKPAGADQEDKEQQQEEEDIEERRSKEIERLHKMGIPVPGVSINVDSKLSATVWLEDLEVDCTNKIFADRVRAVVERAVEVTAPLWD